VATHFGRLSLITGPEQFLASRELTRQIAEARLEDTQASVSTAQGSDLVPALLEQMSGGDLFSPATIACILEAEKTPKAMETQLLTLASDVPDEVALIIGHAGGAEGKALLGKLTPLAATVISHPIIKKPAELAAFVTEEVRAGGKTISQAAARHLVDAIGVDTRSLAGAVSQLLADADPDVETISVGIVSHYFAGLASVTQFAVSDDVMAGRVSEAMVKLRWALATGVPHARITAAIASSLRQIGTYVAISRTRTPTADEVGIPSWKMKSFAPGAKAWSERAVGQAIRAVSQADAQVKGAAQDPDYALERLIIRLAALRRSAHEGAATSA